MNKIKCISKAPAVTLTALLSLLLIVPAQAQLLDKDTRNVHRDKEMKQHSETFAWWPTDAKPAPVKDEVKGGYWWWPAKTGSVKDLWGNRGYVYVYKLIYDYKEKDEAKPLPPPPPPPKVETRSSLLIKKIIRNVKIYFDYNKSDLREDHYAILNRAISSLTHNPKASILITGNCDVRGSDEYNLKLGKRRGDTVQNYMLQKGIPEERIKIVSRGKLDAVAPVKDLIGMQKDRNAQFMVAEVDEVEIPVNQVPPANATLQMMDKQSSTQKYIVEEKQNVESSVKVSTREYIIQPNDSLWKIAAKEMGNGNRWKYLYELNQDRIKDANKLKKGTVIIIPIE